MRRLAVLFPILVLLGIAALPGSIAPVAATTAACPPNPSPPNPADPSMVLSQPVAGASVSSPVHIAGQARVFEAHVAITIYGASGMAIAETSTLAAEAGPTLAPFATDVPFAVLIDQPGCIRVWEPSAMDGSPRNVVQVEVNLKAPATSPTVAPTSVPIAPPSTGDAGLADADAETFAPILLAAVLLTLALCVRLRRGGIRP